MAQTTEERARAKREHAARAAQWSVEPRDASAMADLERDDYATLVALTREVQRVALPMPYGDEISSLAALKVARLYSATGDPGRAVRLAVRIAEREVARVRMGDVSLEAWAGDDTDLLERAVASDTGSTVSRWAPRPDTAYNVTLRDVLSVALDVMGDDTATDLVRAYLAHANGCQRCRDAVTRAVAPAGILAHMEGLSAAADRATYNGRNYASRKALAALADYVRSALDVRDCRPRHGRNLADTATEQRARLARDMGDRPARPLTRPDVDTVTTARLVTDDYGWQVRARVTARPLTDVERDTVSRPARRTVSATHAGEGTDTVSTAPAGSADRSDTTGMVRTFKAPAPRKAAGTGSTGPTVPARLPR